MLRADAPFARWRQGANPFTFVSDEVESALVQARAVAGDKNSASRAPTFSGSICGPVLLGAGTRVFDQLGTEHIELEQIRLLETPGATHFENRVVK